MRNAKGEARTVSIVGVDEIDTARGYISWVSPMARALLKAREGDTVTLNTPGGVEELDILDVRYAPLATGTATAGRPRVDARGARRHYCTPWTRISPNSSASSRRCSRTRARCVRRTSRCGATSRPRIERNRELTDRVQQAGARLDALIARMPAE